MGSCCGRQQNRGDKRHSQSLRTHPAGESENKSSSRNISGNTTSSSLDPDRQLGLDTRNNTSHRSAGLPIHPSPSNTLAFNDQQGNDSLRGPIPRGPIPRMRNERVESSQTASPERGQESRHRSSPQQPSAGNAQAKALQCDLSVLPRKPSGLASDPDDYSLQRFIHGGSAETPWHGIESLGPEFPPQVCDQEQVIHERIIINDEVCVHYMYAGDDQSDCDSVLAMRGSDTGWEW